MIYLNLDPSGIFGIFLILSGIIFLIVPRKFNELLAIHFALFGIVFAFFVGRPDIIFTPLILIAFGALAYLLLKKEAYAERIGILYLSLAGIFVLYTGVSRLGIFSSSLDPLLIISGVLFLACAILSCKKKERIAHFAALAFIITGLFLTMTYTEPLYSPNRVDCLSGSPIDEIVTAIDCNMLTKPICLSAGEQISAEDIESRIGGGANIEFSCMFPNFLCAGENPPISGLPDIITANEDVAFRIYAGFAEDSTEENPIYLLEVTSA